MKFLIYISKLVTSVTLFAHWITDMAMTAAERKAAQRARDLKKINFLDEHRYFLSISLAEFLADLRSTRQSQFDCLSDPDSIDIQRDNALTTIKNLDLSILRVTTLLNDLKDVFY